MRETARGHIHTMSMRSTADKAHGREDGPSLEANEPTAAAETPFSPLLSLLTSEETVPALLECEKAVLVTKEHDYDRVPERSELTQLTPTILRISTEADAERALQALEEVTGKTSTAPDPRRSQRNRGSSLKDALLDCHQMLLSTRQKLLEPADESISRHLREVVDLQATLIHDLQEQVHVRDVELSSARRDKEQLQARLDRMERRLSILQRRSRDNDDQQDDVPESPRYAKHDSLTRVAQSESRRRRSRSRSSSVDPVKTQRSKSSHTPQNSLEISQRAPPSKRSLSEDHNHTPNKRARASTTKLVEEDPIMVVAAGYSGLGLMLPCSQRTKCSGKDCEDTRTLGKCDNIKVPSWKELKVSTNRSQKHSSSTDLEDLSDEVFLKRHNKLEQDEKRRKRWDAQRTREKFHHDQLLKKYMMKEGSLPTQEKKKDKLDTLLPKLDDLESILISNSVVVSAFGRPLPVVPPGPFVPPANDHLEEVECLRLTRNRSRTRLSTNGSTGNGFSES